MYGAGFTKQAYYQWVKRPQSNRELEEAHLIEVLREVHTEDPEYGHRFLADELQDRGYELSERRVWRLRHVAGIRSVITKRKRRNAEAGAPVGDDLVEREFIAEQPNLLWLTDITEHWTKEGRLYLCAVKDVRSNRIVGYSIGDRMRATLAVTALENAVEQRGYPQGTIVHSDRGGQFRSRSFQHALTNHQLQGSMGSVGAAGDNAAMESFSRCCRKTCSTGKRGKHDSSSVSRSWRGLRGSIIASVASVG